jgi:signal transduction histidine kinase
MLNLRGNAVECIERVRIQRPAKLIGEQVVLCAEGTGIGIPASDLGQIFQP